MDSMRAISEPVPTDDEVQLMLGLVDPDPEDDEEE